MLTRETSLITFPKEKMINTVITYGPENLIKTRMGVAIAKVSFHLPKVCRLEFLVGTI